MYNWSIDEKRFKARNKQAHAIWKLEQMVNFGLAEGEKIPVSQLKKYWPKLNLDRNRSRLLEILLHEK